MKQHVHIGHAVVGDADLREEAQWILHHHERVDGGGYPHGPAGEAIPLESRIILVADAYEAMTSDRVMPEEKALAELEANAGTQIDARCVRAPVACLGGGAQPLRRAA
jgi:HD-GYP domain-containing protein (c-di-GMP phosphodiesterase class II)